MPHPQLPQRTFSPDPVNDEGTVEQSKNMLRGSLPFCSQTMLLSTPSRLSFSTASMEPAVHEYLYAGNYQNLPAALSVEDPHSILWVTPGHVSLDITAQESTHFGTHTSHYHPGEMCSFPQNGLPYQDNYSLEYPTQYLASTYPRTQNPLNFNALSHDVGISESYPPAVYQIEPPKHPEIIDFTDQDIGSHLIQLKHDPEGCDYVASHVKMEESHRYESPFSDLTRASSPPDEAVDYPHSAYAEGDGTIDRELPYAQLIYQALMGAPEKTMVLRDIYDWFKKHTDKANSSETKGWQNSIRHNLSMNGAFEKVDQPCEEARKGFMWRLTRDAIRNGVKSTTRYRSKQPAKRGNRTHHPQPQRQASGSKGGQAARRSARMRRGNRAGNIHGSDPCISRSVPSEIGPAFSSGEASTSYTLGPYGENELDACQGIKHEDYCSPLVAPHLELFPSVRIYPAIPTSHDMVMNDPHFMLDQGPTQRLFTNSPSPSADEPRTPESPGGWNEDLSLGAPCVFDESAYRAYAG